ncbi:hypothetical protein D3C83_183660 [compost metagenome]
MLLFKTEGRNNADTLKTYLGSNTWARGNDRIMFGDKRVSIDNVSGHVILKRL